VIEVPHRHDLVPNSCVNSEVLMFNRKLQKLKKVYPNLTVISVDTARDFFTRSGFHLNSLGKEHAARRIVSVISNLLNTNKSVPIVLKWIDNQMPCEVSSDGRGYDRTSLLSLNTNCDKKKMEKLVSEGILKSHEFYILASCCFITITSQIDRQIATYYVLFS
jgi:hypothetical protein